jgi:drug/metabolite transporter (DMT)-like permease
MQKLFIQPVQRAYLELHIAVFLFGFTAILGKLIQMNAFMLVWWRVLITSISLLLFMKGGAAIRKLPQRLVIRVMGVGVLVALHWLLFYGAIKAANASVALIGMATVAFFTALIEPVVMRRRVKALELGLGLLVIPGIVLIVNSIQEGFIFGMALALTSAFLAALFGTLNKFYIAKDTDPVALTFLQLSSSWLFLCLLLWPVERTFHILDDGFFPSTLEDWGYMALLALLCTTIGYVLAIRSLRHLPAFAFNLTINLEPVYGMLLAWAILEEHKSVGPKFYIGAGLIVLIVSLYPWLQKKVGNG